MKKTSGKKLALNKETVKAIATNDLNLVRGGASGTYCAGCGTGTRCPQLKF